MLAKKTLAIQSIKDLQEDLKSSAKVTDLLDVMALSFLHTTMTIEPKSVLCFQCVVDQCMASRQHVRTVWTWECAIKSLHFDTGTCPPEDWGLPKSSLRRRKGPLGLGPIVPFSPIRLLGSIGSSKEPQVPYGEFIVGRRWIYSNLPLPSLVLLFFTKPKASTLKHMLVSFVEMHFSLLDCPRAH